MNAIRLTLVMAVGCVGLAACATSQEPAPSASSGSPSPTGGSTAAQPISSTVAAPPASGAQGTSQAPDCVGLSICTPPPPDAEGNPPCFYSDGWQPTGSGAGVEVWYFTEPQNVSTPGKVTAVVRKKDGTEVSEAADIEAGQQTHRFEFPAIAESDVQQVFLDTAQGRCWVLGPSGG